MPDEGNLEIVRVSAAVRQRVGDGYPESEIAAAVRDGFREYEGAAVRQFVPVLVERSAIERLRKGTAAPPGS